MMYQKYPLKTIVHLKELDGAPAMVVSFDKQSGLYDVLLNSDSTIMKGLTEDELNFWD